MQNWPAQTRAFSFLASSSYESRGNEVEFLPDESTVSKDCGGEKPPPPQTPPVVTPCAFVVFVGLVDAIA
jgi:hypothetical protein